MIDLLALKEAIYEVGLLFSKPSHPTEAQINAYATALQRYTPAQVTHAFNLVIIEGDDHFPALSKILKHLRPQELATEDIGNLLATEIIKAVQANGAHKLREALDSLSEPAKQVVALNTQILVDISNSTIDQLPTIRAQIRGLAKAAAESQRAARKNEKLQSLGIDTSNVLDMRKHGIKAIDFSSLKPEGA